MNIKNMKLPIIIAIGMILAVAICFLTGVMKEPVIKEHKFDYSVTYKLDGEVKTYEGCFKCSFAGHDEHDYTTARAYVGEYMNNGKSLDSFSFVVAQKDGVELSVIRFDEKNV